ALPDEDQAARGRAAGGPGPADAGRAGAGRAGTGRAGTGRAVRRLAHKPYAHSTQRTHQGEKMKAKLIAIAAGTTLLLSGCGLVGGGTDSVGETDGDLTKLTVGATPVPQGDILNFVQENLAEDA